MRFLSVILIGCLLSACATVTRGRDEVITVDSNPPGANATIVCARNVSASGTTPARLTIPREAQLCRVDVEKSGMQTQKIQLERGINGHYWMNFIYAAGIPIGAILAFGGTESQGTAGGVVAVGSVVLGITGFIVDRATGAMYDHNPNVIKVTLQPEH
jgi:hypothetical protein